MRLILSLLILFFVQSFVKADYEYAICSLVPVDGATNTITGSIKFQKLDTDNYLSMVYNLTSSGLADGNYGITINNYGYPLSNLGGAFNPSNQSGCLVYDITLSEGTDSTSLNTGLTLQGVNSLIGRSISLYDASVCPKPSPVDLIVKGVAATPNVVSNCVIGFANTTTLPQGYTGKNLAAASTEIDANAAAILYTTSGAGEASITGTVVFTKSVGNEVLVESAIKGLNKDAHGFHIHAFGQFSNDGTALGGHWIGNSEQVHSLPSTLNTSSNRHSGDLGNICSFDSKFENAYYSYSTNYFGTINGVFGRGFAVHKTRDIGNSSNVGGARILQGVIAIVNPSSNKDIVITAPSDFTFDNICADGAIDGTASSSSKLFISFFTLTLFSSLLILLL